MQYELILGLEIHLQLKTDKKMFCYCKNDPFFSKPNTNVCPTCLGLPGALPVPNKEAILTAQKMAFALGSNLNSNIIFERKNYFYPDLPKGYQITCPHDPISTGGSIDLSYFDSGIVEFEEIHLEEDTGKSIHKTSETLLDYNKSGVPLLEIVTRPSFRNINDATNFCKEIQRIARSINASDADMEKGQMRLEANISMRKVGETKLPSYKVEIKNINSFSFLRKAVTYEIKRQSEALDLGEKLIQETRGFNEAKGKTFSQRSKENAHDYRYFADPDIPRIEFDKKWLEDVTKIKYKLPIVLRNEFLESGLNKNYIDIFIDNESLMNKYLKLKLLAKSKLPDVKPNKLADWIVNDDKYKNLSVDEIVYAQLKAASDKISDPELKMIVQSVLSAYPTEVEQYKNGKTALLQFFIGQVMKETKGRADAPIVLEVIKSII